MHPMSMIPVQKQLKKLSKLCEMGIGDPKRSRACAVKTESHLPGVLTAKHK